MMGRQTADGPLGRPGRTFSVGSPGRRDGARSDGPSLPARPWSPTRYSLGRKAPERSSACHKTADASGANAHRADGASVPEPLPGTKPPRPTLTVALAAGLGRANGAAVASTSAAPERRLRTGWRGPAARRGRRPGRRLASRCARTAGAPPPGAHGSERGGPDPVAARHAVVEGADRRPPPFGVTACEIAVGVQLAAGELPLQHHADAGRVPLVVGDRRLELAELPRQHDVVVDLAVDVERQVGRRDLGQVDGHARLVLLVVVEADTRTGGHDVSRLGTVDARLPRALVRDLDDLAVLVARDSLPYSPMYQTLP